MGNDLQLYLERNCKLDKVTNFQKVSEVTAIKTFNGMIPHLKRGYEEWKTAHTSAYLSPLTSEIGLTKPFICIRKNVLKMKTQIPGKNG